ncbi:MAG TPA: hypothetical protein VF713_19825 [Thermoanaerobaculia bacterium]
MKRILVAILMLLITPVIMEKHGFTSPEDAKKTIQDLGMKYQLVTDYTSMIVLADGDFAKSGIARTNREWISVEEKARAARVAPTMNLVDAERPMFNGPAYTTRGAGRWIR